MRICKCGNPENKVKFNKGQNKCCECSKRLQREYYIKNRELCRQKLRDRRKNLRLFLVDYKIKTGCLKCRENHPSCLDFHHRDPKEKEFDLSCSAQHGFSMKRILKEMKKCDLLCTNCHRKLHWEEKYKYKNGNWC